MTSSTNINQNRTLATVLHLSVFSQFFIPLGNFIFPTLLWLSRKEDPFVDHHGRSALNFQLSIFLYSVFLIAAGAVTIIFFGLKLSVGEAFYLGDDSFRLDNFSEAVPFIIIISVLGITLFGLFILQIFTVISASISANEGKKYNYPLTINFLGSVDPDTNHHSNQSKNEQFNSTQKQAL
ncbi:DUF4870 domain-containing protein [Gramella sp. BOM4]|nr:DUF4870 domain-containing protein [Christiangramia bathymodioli]